MIAPRPRLFAPVVLVALVLVAVPQRLAAQSEAREQKFFRPSEQFWSMELELSGTFDSNIDQDDENIDSRGLSAGLLIRGRKRGETHLFRLTYRADVQSFTNSERWDRASNDVAAMFFQSLGRKLTVGAIGNYSLRTSTEDRELANVYGGWSQLEYRPSRALRLGFYGAHRWIRPVDGQGEDLLFFGTDVGGRLGRAHLWEVGVRRGTSESPSLYRRYQRRRYRGEYALRLGRNDVLDLRVEHRRRRFPDRPVELRPEGPLAPREDRRWIGTLTWVHRFSGAGRIDVKYAHQRRASNDPRKDFTDHRVDVRLRVPLFGRDRRPPGRSTGPPMPGLPDGAGVSGDGTLEQLRFLSERELPEPSEDPAIRRGSHWKELLAVQGVPTKVSRRPQFFEELWFYGASWFVLRHGRVVDWHDAGSLKLAPSPPPESNRASREIVIEHWKRKQRLPVPAEPQPEDEEAPAVSSHSGTSFVEESLPAAYQRASQAEVVLKDGTRLRGVLTKFDNGLAHILLFRDNEKSLLTTLPEGLVDKEASHWLSER